MAVDPRRHSQSRSAVTVPPPHWRWAQSLRERRAPPRQPARQPARDRARLRARRLRLHHAAAGRADASRRHPRAGAARQRSGGDHRHLRRQSAELAVHLGVDLRHGPADGRASKAASIPRPCTATSSCCGTRCWIPRRSFSMQRHAVLAAAVADAGRQRADWPADGSNRLLYFEERRPRLAAAYYESDVGRGRIAVPLASLAHRNA